MSEDFPRMLAPMIDTIYLAYPPKKVIPATVTLHSDELRETASFCNQSISQFIEAAIRDRLDDVQAAMGEAEV